MLFVVLTLLVCLAVAAAVALFVAFPGRGRPLPDALTSVRPTPRRGTTRRPFAARSGTRGHAQEARG